MHLIKTKSGTFSPMDSSDHDEASKIPPGEVVSAKRSRNYLFHKKAFALIKLGFENQDKYDSMEVYRKVITIRAGYFDEVVGKDEETYYLPKSLSFEAMSAEKFQQWYDSTLLIISGDMSTQPEVIQAELNSFF